MTATTGKRTGAEARDDPSTAFRYILIKLASRCNLDCDYCYWFRDPEVLNRPPRLTDEAQAAFIVRLEEHIERFALKSFSILFHGGEPMLFGQRRFLDLLTSLRRLEARTRCELRLSMTTNGVLADDRWAQIFRLFGVRVTVSIDGPAAIHDARRPDLKGNGTHARVVEGLAALRRRGVDVGVLSVCDPAADPEVITRYFVEDLGLPHFDILLPDATHADRPASIADFYARLFDLWYDRYGSQGIDIRYPRAILKGMLGGDAHLESIGYGPIETLTLLTDGALEPLDVLRIAGAERTDSATNVFDNAIQDVTQEPAWQAAREASLTLCDECVACPYALCCGGGYLPHRWSPERGYDNPSVYCADLKAIFAHVWNRVAPDLSVQNGGGQTIPMNKALPGGVAVAASDQDAGTIGGAGL